jgi:hypothetical protein
MFRVMMKTTREVMEVRMKKKIPQMRIIHLVLIQMVLIIRCHQMSTMARDKSNLKRRKTRKPMASRKLDHTNNPASL